MNTRSFGPLQSLIALTLLQAALPLRSALSAEPTPSLAPSATPSAIPSPSPSSSPSPLTASSGTPKLAKTVGVLKRLELIPTQGGGKNPLRLFAPKLPQEIPSSGQDWAVSFRLESEDSGAAVLHEKKALKLKKGAVELNLARKEGKDRSTLSTINTTGDVQDFELLTEVEVTQIKAGEEAPQGEPQGFALAGPTFMGHSLSRSGTAAGTSSGDFSGWVTGVRGVYRRRIFKNFTDHLPGQIKVFVDGSGTLAHSVLGDASAGGMPLWFDARATVNVYEHRRIRFEDFRISTEGSIVGAGTFSRSESFYGPELLWVWRL